jgi:hypothetical protein
MNTYEFDRMFKIGPAFGFWALSFCLMAPRFASLSFRRKPSPLQRFWLSLLARQAFTNSLTRGFYNKNQPADR